MHIEILGPGCKKCDALGRATDKAIADLGLDITVTKIDDYAQIAQRGVMSTPGFAIDGTLLTTGRVLSVDEIKQLVTDAT